jgi:hypothetical protein
MTQKTNKNYEETICEALCRQRSNYAEASELTGKLRACFENGQDPVGLLEQLSTVLARVAQVDEQMQKSRQEWTTAPAHDSVRVQELAKQNRLVLEDLLNQIRAAEDLALQAKERLAPELDLRTRGLQMRKAYGSAANVG